jgi:hypothetical protein
MVEMYNMVYMGKPTYGGWVTFTAHLQLKYGYPLYKIAKRTEKLKNGEKKLRPYGYGSSYQNIAIEDLVKLPNLMITAIDKSNYEHLSAFPDGTTIVIHDPTEVKSKASKPVLDNLGRFKVITIRETVKTMLAEKHNIESKFLYHPFYTYPFTKDKNPSKSIAISRIDFDKHTDIIIRANMALPDDKVVDIYGAKNDLYVFHHLKTKLGLDLDKYYKGQFQKDYVELSNMLANAKFMVDLSAIKGDGGGSQYTFLEAIHNECVLVLNKAWVEGVATPFVHGVNCFIVGGEQELVALLNSNIDTKPIVREAKKLLANHIDNSWEL